jgi:hypothetical protein
LAIWASEELARLSNIGPVPLPLPCPASASLLDLSRFPFSVPLPLLGVVDGYLRHVLNSALLHILGAVANNHFEVIADLLDHPNLVGGYTPLMPHYLFAVLFEKVEVPRALARVKVDTHSGVAATT